MGFNFHLKKLIIQGQSIFTKKLHYSKVSLSLISIVHIITASLLFNLIFKENFFIPVLIIFIKKNKLGVRFFGCIGLSLVLPIFQNLAIFGSDTNAFQIEESPGPNSRPSSVPCKTLNISSNFGFTVAYTPQMLKMPL
jgi:hypothetical protein